MSLTTRGFAAVLVVALAGGPLAAQEPAIVVSAMGGGYSQLVQLDGTHFNRGFTLGACGGLELNKYFALHADLTWARTLAHGPVMFSGAEVNRYFYGAHLEFRAPLERGLVPFAFVGAGAVTIDPGDVPAARGLESGLSRSTFYYEPDAAEAHLWDAAFTKPAATFGVGLFYFEVPGARMEMFVEGKALVYHWDRAGYDVTQVDVTYALGLSYRFGAR
jgi:hypothetical protein